MDSSILNPAWPPRNSRGHRRGVRWAGLGPARGRMGRREPFIRVCYVLGPGPSAFHELANLKLHQRPRK